MTPVSQAAASPDFAAQDAGLPGEPVPSHPAHQIHAPTPGITATLINDLRELFKVRVTGMVLVTGWAGFYLGSMQSGISSVQRGLLDTLIGIGLVSAGASALNQALERTSDAKMKRTADRPIAAGRISLAQGIVAGTRLSRARRMVAAAAHQSAHRFSGSAYGFLLRGDLHAAQTRHFPRNLHRRIPRSHGPAARLDRCPRTH